jgi:hypothetical protein
MRIRHDGPITIFEDNQAAIALTIHPSGGRTRYLELYMAAIREQVELGLKSVRSKNGTISNGREKLIIIAIKL